MKSRIIPLLILMIASYLQVLGQFNTGLILDDASYERVANVSDQIEIQSGQKYIPRKVNLTRFCPPIRHQGDISSCVGWSAGYGAMTIERAIQNGWTDKEYIAEQANSALFIYNQISNTSCEGIRMPDALDLIQEKGNCLARDFDFDVNDCSKEADPSLFEKAEEFKLEDYIRLFDAEEKAENKVEHVKRILAQKKPVLIGMQVLSNFYAIGKGEQSWLPSVGDSGYAGGHAMVVVGYNDDQFHAGRSDIPDNQKGAFLLMNSWGRNWGLGGYIWIRYKDFAQYCKHAYALMLSGASPVDLEADVTPNPNTSGTSMRKLAGAFGFQSYTGEWFNDKPVFKEELVELNGEIYSLDNRKVGDQFQLKIKSDFAQGYIYAFSVDPMGKVEVHFPRSSEYNPKFEDLNESALLMDRGSALTIPSATSALTISEPGTDHLVVLFSERKIKPKYINALGARLAASDDDINAELPRLLERHMIPFSDITYRSNEMGFEVGTRSAGKIVPLILQVHSE